MKFRILSIAVAVCIIAYHSPPAHSAEITVKKAAELNIIRFDGGIVPEDVQRFEEVASIYAGRYNEKTIVLLDSPGGKVVPGLRIGEIIRASGFATAVTNGAMCSSACAMIWLAGTERLVGSAAKVGFHAAYTGSGDDVRVSGQGNAFIGAYLAKLGLSYEAIALATSADPTAMRWLTPEDAKQAGIRVRLIPDSDPEPPRPSVPPTVDGTPAERQAKNVVQAYYAYWSRSGTNVEALASYYPETAMFYGTRQSREQVMIEKRKFSVRWPVRNYTVKGPTLFAQCADTCSVTGVVEWDVSSQERGARSVGTANFVLKIALDGTGGGVILSENGSVLSARNDATGSTQANATTAEPNSTPAYASGRQARIEYESWFNSIPPGAFQQGAAFWAENRSLKVPPSCAQPGTSAEWQNGCLAARQRLAPSDVRRRAEVDFKSGWNSL